MAKYFLALQTEVVKYIDHSRPEGIRYIKQDVPVFTFHTFYFKSLSIFVYHISVNVLLSITKVKQYQARLVQRWGTNLKHHVLKSRQICNIFRL